MLYSFPHSVNLGFIDNVSAFIVSVGIIFCLVKAKLNIVHFMVVT